MQFQSFLQQFAKSAKESAMTNIENFPSTIQTPTTERKLSADLDTFITELMNR
jgi:hypothetical protein